MPLRTGHGAGTGSPRIEVLPPDELPNPVADPLAVLTGDISDRLSGRFHGSTTARAAGAKGGRAKAGKVRLARSLGLSGLADNPAFAPYKASAASLLAAHCGELSKLAGGKCGTGPSTMVASAALQVAASRFLFDQAIASGDPATFKTASQLSDASRQNLLAAYELAVREAKLRKDQDGDDVMSLRLASIRAREAAQ